MRTILVMVVGPLLGLCFLASGVYSFFHQTERIGVVQSSTFVLIGLYLLYAAGREYVRTRRSQIAGPKDG